MAKDTKQPEQQSGQGDHLLVSVMPKEFRGKEGLKRPVMGEPVATVAAAPVVPPKPPAPPKRVTPEGARGSVPLPPAKKPFPVLPVVIGVVVIMLVTGGGIIALMTLTQSTEPEVVEDTRPPIVVTQPVVVVEEEPDEAPDEEVPEVVSPFADGIALGADSDSDGLTDVEELMYETQATRPDTDGDGFLDGNEVFHLYHPNGREPLRLLDTGDVTVFDQPSFPYTIYTPTTWILQANPTERQLILVAPTSESFQVIEQAIEPTETVRSWYLANTVASQQQVLESFRTKQGFVGAWTPDHLTAYIRFDDTTVLVFTYNLGNKNRIEYRQTFEMFINSLSLRS